MTEAAAGNSGPVFRLIYRSRSRIGAAERKHQLGEISCAARRLRLVIALIAPRP
jgi:hypothetical protein